MSDPWAPLRRHTAARIGLGHVGGALPTREVLAFQAAHAEARDAVLLPWDRTELVARLDAADHAHVTVRSQAPDRATFLRRPDLGRALHPEDRGLLVSEPHTCDMAIVVTNGLSSTAVARHAADLLDAVRIQARQQGLALGPVVLVDQGRVAVGDEIGELLRAPLVAVIVGERPGLTSTDSLGAYLTWGPRPGRTDAERNCISNIRPDGQPLGVAAARLVWLAKTAVSLKLTGVALKDDAPIDRLLGPG